MDDAAKLELFKATIHEICQRLGVTYKDVTEEGPSGEQRYVSEFYVRGPLYDLCVRPSMEPLFGRDVTLFVKPHNVVQIRQRKDLRLHVSVDEGPSGGWSGDIVPDLDVSFEVACQQVKERFFEEHIPLQTVEDLVADIHEKKTELET